jgi:hypothetical protein
LEALTEVRGRRSEEVRGGISNLEFQISKIGKAGRNGKGGEGGTETTTDDGLRDDGTTEGENGVEKGK